MISLTKIRIISGVVLGLLYSFSLYSFLYIMRESLRILSVTDDYDVWLLSREEVNFYNLVLAFISVIIGQSTCFWYWNDRPRKLLEKNKRLRISILNDQRVLNWFFLYVFFQLAVFYGYYFGFTIKGAFYTFSLYPDYKYLFILIIIVLFLNSWISILKIINGKRKFWFLASALVVSLISFSFSKINMIDYRAINAIILNKSVYNNFLLDLPESNAEHLWYPNFKEPIYLAMSKGSDKKSIPVIIINNYEVAFDDLPIVLSDLLSQIDEFRARFMAFRLIIHKGVPMQYVLRLQEELLKSGIHRVAYAIIPHNPEFDQRYYRDFSFNVRLPDFKYTKDEIYKLVSEADGIKNVILIQHVDSRLYIINDSLVLADELTRFYENIIREDSNYIILYEVNEKKSLEDYLIVLTSYAKVLHSMRDEHSIITLGKSYYSLEIEQHKNVTEKYQYRLVELRQ